MAIPVMSIADLAEGESACVRLQGVEVLVSHVHGQFYAVHAQCSHAAQSLAHGRIRDEQISCPLHGARFNIRTGACSKGPAQAPIAAFPVIIEAGKVCVEMGSMTR